MLAGAKARLIESWESARFVSPRIIEAFKKVKRELFVLPEFKDDAYDDVPLPVLANQTISQPSTVVLMLDALQVRPGMKVLEIGAGSGYNAALLGVLAGKGKVFSTEIVPELAVFATKNLKKAGIKNVKVVKWDGSQGYKKEAPYDRIICTAGAPKIPQVYIDQLKEGGIVLIPVGTTYNQQMIRAKKVKGKLEQENLGDYIFVPLTGKYGIK